MDDHSWYILLKLNSKYQYFKSVQSDSRLFKTEQFSSIQFHNLFFDSVLIQN